MLPRVEGSDGRFTVFAKGEPEIYINNKKVRDAKELKQLKSTEIKSVDIITSPGAKYNAEVGAVIRIKTIKRQDDGLSIEAYTQTKYNDWWTNYEDFTVKYRSGGLEVFGTGSFYNHHYSEDPVLSSELLFDNTPIHIDQTAPNSVWFTSVHGKAGLSYDFDENNSIGMTYGCFGELYGGGEMNGSQTIYRNGQLEGKVSQWMKIDHRTIPDHDANIYYVGKIGKLGIDFNGTWLWQKTIRRDIETERSTELEDRDIHSNAEDRRRMLAAKLVLSYPVWKGELSVGTETTNTHSNGMSENIEGWVPASENHIKENNLAGFAEYEVQLGHWSLDAGLRYEHVTTDYESYSIRSDIQPEPSRTYNDIFPNVSAGWQKDKWSLQLSYTKRISRPSYHSLSNYVQYDNRYQVEGGNPMLRPAIRQDIDFSATYSWLSFNAGFEHYSDKILNFSSLYQKGREVIMWRNENFDDFNCCHASIVASPKWGIYTPTLTLGYFQQFFDVKQYGIDHSLTRPEWSINLRNWLALGETAKAMVYIHYATTHDYGFSRQHHEFNVNARLQKTFLKGQLTAVLFANDIFRTLRDKWKGYYPIEVLTRDANQYSREIGISLQYNFNATRSKYKGTGAGNAESLLFKRIPPLLEFGLLFADLFKRLLPSKALFTFFAVDDIIQPGGYSQDIRACWYHLLQFVALQLLRRGLEHLRHPLVEAALTINHHFAQGIHIGNQEDRIAFELTTQHIATLKVWMMEVEPPKTVRQRKEPIPRRAYLLPTIGTNPYIAHRYLRLHVDHHHLSPGKHDRRQQQ